MKRTIFLPIICLMAFMALFSITSCDKPGIVEEDLNGFDVQNPVFEQNRIIFERIKSSVDTKAEIRKINEEAGRYVDEKGDVYFNEEDFKKIESARSTPNARSATIYNSWYGPSNDGIVVVSYWDNGAYHHFATLQSGEAFLTCPSAWTLCNSYNQYLLQGFDLYQGYCVTGTPDCCRDVYGRFWDGTTMKDNDRFSFDMNHNDGADWWEARIRNSLATGWFPGRGYVENLGGCGYGFNNQCQAGNCPGPVCGFYE
jgi:hypothetical protein